MVAVVVVTERRVPAEITRVLRCVAGQLVHLLYHARYHDVADDGHGGREHDEDGENDHGTGYPLGAAVERIDDRQERERQEQADRDQA